MSPPSDGRALASTVSGKKLRVFHASQDATAYVRRDGVVNISLNLRLGFGDNQSSYTKAIAQWYTELSDFNATAPDGFLVESSIYDDVDWHFVHLRFEPELPPWIIHNVSISYVVRHAVCLREDRQELRLPWLMDYPHKVHNSTVTLRGALALNESCYRDLCDCGEGKLCSNTTEGLPEEPIFSWSWRRPVGLACPLQREGWEYTSLGIAAAVVVVVVMLVAMVRKVTLQERTYEESKAFTQNNCTAIVPAEPQQMETMAAAAGGVGPWPDGDAQGCDSFADAATNPEHHAGIGSL